MPIGIYEAFVRAWSCLVQSCCLHWLNDRPYQSFDDLKSSQVIEEGQAEFYALSSSNYYVGWHWVHWIRRTWSTLLKRKSEDTIPLEALGSRQGSNIKQFPYNDNRATPDYHPYPQEPANNNVVSLSAIKRNTLTEEQSARFAALLAEAFEAERVNTAYLRGLDSSCDELLYLGWTRTKYLAATVQEANGKLRDANVECSGQGPAGHNFQHEARIGVQSSHMVYEQHTSNDSNFPSNGSEQDLVHLYNENGSMYETERRFNHINEDHDTLDLTLAKSVQLSESSIATNSVSRNCAGSEDDSDLDIPSIVVRDHPGKLFKRSPQPPSTRSEHDTLDSSQDSWHSRKLSSDSRYQTRTSWELIVQYNISAEICFMGGQFQTGAADTIELKQDAYSIYESNTQVQMKREFDLALVLDGSAPAADRQSCIPEMCNDEDTSYTTGQFVTSWMLQVYTCSWLEFSHYLLFAQREIETDAIVSYLGYVHFSTLVRAMWFYDGTSEVGSGAQSIRPSRSSVTDDVPFYIHQIYVHGSDEGSHAMEHIQLVRHRQPSGSPKASDMAQVRLSSYSSDQTSVSSGRSPASSGVFSPPRRVGTKLTDFEVDQDCSMY